MILRKKYLIAFLLFFFISIPPIFLGITAYKPILNVYPQIAELEIQDYYITLGFIFTLYCLFFWFSFKKSIQNLFNFLKNSIHISQFLLLMVVIIESIYLLYFNKYSYPFLVRTPNFRDVGIILEENFAVPILLSIIFITLVFFFILIKTDKITTKIHSIFFNLITIILISLLSFRIVNLNHHDFAYFAGPINDVLHGKYLLHNSPSQYGFLSIIFLSLIFRVIPLSLMNLTIVNAVIVTLGFILVFFLLQLLYKNKLLSLFTIVFIIFLNHTIQIVPEITVLQTSFLRFGMWVILALSICLKEFYQGVKYKKLLELLPYLILTLSVFWILDNGTYILFAYLSYKMFNHLKSGFLVSIRSILFEFFKVGISISLGFIIIKIFYNLFLGISPNWNYYLSDPSLYLGGFGLIALPSSSWHWVIMTCYLLILTYFITIKRFRKGYFLNKKENIISFILFYGIFQFSYYMGRSHLNNLHHVIIPFLICVFYIIEIFLSNIKDTGKKSYYFLGSLICSLALSLSLYFIFIQGSKNIVSYNFFTSVNILKQRKEIEKDYIDRTLSPSTITLLREKYGDYIDRYGLTLVSMNDTWFLINLKMANNIESNNLRYFVRVEPLRKIAESILKADYQYVFIDIYMQEGFGQVETIYKEIKNNYREKEKIGSLMVIEKVQ